MNSCTRLALAFVCFLLSYMSHADDHGISFGSIKISDSIYMVYGKGGFTGGNLGLLVGDDGVVLIDDSLDGMLDKMQKEISTITKQPISFLVNTHVHGDHTGNNSHYGKNGTYIIGHDNLRKQMAADTTRTKDALPVITFSQEMSFHFNDTVANVIHVPSAHTNGDAVIFFPEDNVIHLGDLMFNGMFPFIDPSSGGSLNGYIAGQKQILALIDEQTKIIPGHGVLATKQDLQASVDMLEDAKYIIESLLAKGNNEAKILKLNPLKKYHDKWNWGFITTEKMTKQVIAGVTHSHTNTTVQPHSH